MYCILGSMKENGELTPATGWRSSWIFVTALFTLTSFVETLGFGHLGAFTPLYLRELGVVTEDIPRWTGYLAAASFIIGLPLAPFWGVWADKYGRKLIIVRSAFGEALIFLIAAVSTNVWHLLIARMLVGFILGNTGVMYALVSHVAPKYHWSFAIGMVGLGGTLGMSVGPLLGGHLVTLWGIRPLLMIDALLSLSIGLLLTVALQEPPAPRSIGGSSLRMLVELARSIRKTPAIIAIFTAYAVLILGSQMSFPFLPIQVESIYAGSDLPTTIGIVSASFAAASAVFTPLWGRLGDWQGHRRMLLAATFFLIPSLAAQAFVTDIPQLLIVRVTQGMFQAAISPLAMALVALHSPEERRASILNLSLFPNYFAWIIGSSVGAALATVSLQLLFLVSAGILALGLLMTLRLAPGDHIS